MRPSRPPRSKGRPPPDVFSTASISNDGPTPYQTPVSAVQTAWMSVPATAMSVPFALDGREARERGLGCRARRERGPRRGLPGLRDGSAVPDLLGRQARQQHRPGVLAVLGLRGRANRPGGRPGSSPSSSCRRESEVGDVGQTFPVDRHGGSESHVVDGVRNHRDELPALGDLHLGLRDGCCTRRSGARGMRRPR